MIPNFLSCIVSLGCKVVVLLVLEMQEVRPRTLPDKGEPVLGEMYESVPVVRAGGCRRWLGS